MQVIPFLALALFVLMVGEYPGGFVECVIFEPLNNRLSNGVFSMLHILSTLSKVKKRKRNKTSDLNKHSIEWTLTF